MAIIPNAYDEYDISDQIPYQNLVGNSKDMRNGKFVFGVGNPHPGYMKDPNILNEMGHTVYPKMVYPDGVEGKGVVAKNFNHEVEIMGQASNQVADKIASDIEAMEAKIEHLKKIKAHIEGKQAEAPAPKQAWG